MLVSGDDCGDENENDNAIEGVENNDDDDIEGGDHK